MPVEDLERYSDYNDTEDDEPHGGRHPVTFILKILVAVICIAVIGVIAFRLVLFSHYPDEITRLFYTDTLTAYYTETDGAIGAKTQKLRYPYDDAKDGNFFCNALIVIPGAEELQITLRFNVSTVTRLSETLDEELDPDDPTLFTYRLVDNYGRVYDNLAATASATKSMYRYRKLVFDDVNFDAEQKPEWIRLEVFVRGMDSTATPEEGGDADGRKPYAKILIYEDHEDFHTFSDYKLSDGEVPEA